MSLGLTGYTSKTSRLSSAAERALRQADKALSGSASNIENIEHKDLSGVVNSVLRSIEQAETVLDEEQTEALTSINDQPLDTVWVSPTATEPAGLAKAMTGVKDEMVNNLAKLSEVNERKSEVEKHLAREHQKLTETSDPEIQQKIRDRIKNLVQVFLDIKIERGSRFEALSANRAALRSQINRIREAFRRILHEDTTLAEHIRTLFRYQGITIASILTAVAMAISTLVLALTGGGGSVPAPAPSPKPSDRDNLKEWVKKHLQAIGRPGNLAAKAAAALPGIICSIVSLLLNTLGKTATWLAENMWAMDIAVGTLLLVAARDWLMPPQSKRH